MTGISTACTRQNLNEHQLREALAAAQETPGIGNFDPDSYPQQKAQDLRNNFGKHADVTMLGPFTRPGGLAALVYRRGEMVAELGNTTAVSEVASVTKSFLSTLAGIAYDQNLIRDLDQTVSSSLKDELFGSAHNATITWKHLLQQTSEWQGSLWGKQPSGHAGKRVGQQAAQPGTFFEYNDVRINVLAYALTKLFGTDLATVLKETVMDPIGASDSWSWHAYENATIDLQGNKTPCVSGGSHWGGGIWMNAEDLLLYGLLYQQKGQWQGNTLLSRAWIDLTRQACPCNYMYGLLWWLKSNDQGKQIAYCAEGGGGHAVAVIPAYDMVVVARWMHNWNTFLHLILQTPTDVKHLGTPHIDWSAVNAQNLTDT